MLERFTMFITPEEEFRFDMFLLACVCVPACAITMSMFALGFGASAASGQRPQTSAQVGLACVACCCLFYVAYYVWLKSRDTRDTNAGTVYITTPPKNAPGH